MPHPRHYVVFEHREIFGAARGLKWPRSGAIARAEVPARPSLAKSGSRPIRVTPPPPDNDPGKVTMAQHHGDIIALIAKLILNTLAQTHQRDGPPFSAVAARPKGARASDDGSEGMVDAMHAPGMCGKMLEVTFTPKYTRLH